MMLKYYSFRSRVKYATTLRTPKLLQKKITLFLSSIKMSRKNVNFGDKQIKKSDFYKNKKGNQDR